jgi:tetrahydromethanopterin S-methyltransferase subunit G
MNEDDDLHKRLTPEESFQLGQIVERLDSFRAMLTEHIRDDDNAFKRIHDQLDNMDQKQDIVTKFVHQQRLGAKLLMAFFIAIGTVAGAIYYVLASIVSWGEIRHPY